MWENGRKEFAWEGRTVQLAFSAWATRADIYSMTVEIGALYSLEKDQDPVYGRVH